MVGWRDVRAWYLILAELAGGEPGHIRAVRTEGTCPDEGVGVRCRQLVKELGTFVKKNNGKTEGSEGCNDDLVMAYGIALQAIGDIVQNKIIRIGSARAHKNAWLEMDEEDNGLKPLPRLGWVK